MLVSNGPAADPGRERLYAVTAANGVIHIHDGLDGIVGAARPFAAIELGWGKPDGLTVDADGYPWCRYYGGGRIIRFKFEGRVKRAEPPPARLIIQRSSADPT